MQQAVREVLGGRLASQTARTFAAGIQGVLGYLPHEELPVIDAAAQQVLQQHMHLHAQGTSTTATAHQSCARPAGFTLASANQWCGYRD